MITPEQIKAAIERAGWAITCSGDEAQPWRLSRDQSVMCLSEVELEQFVQVFCVELPIPVTPQSRAEAEQFFRLKWCEFALDSDICEGPDSDVAAEARNQFFYGVFQGEVVYDLREAAPLCCVGAWLDEFIQEEAARRSRSLVQDEDQ